MAFPVRFERTTCSLGGSRSIQLSYENAKKKAAHLSRRRKDDFLLGVRNDDRVASVNDRIIILVCQTHHFGIRAVFFGEIRK